MHAVVPRSFWNVPVPQGLQWTADPWFWYWPLPQFEQLPVPLVPAAQPGHAVLPLLTAHPAPDLQLVPVCAAFCHVLAGHAPHAMLAVDEHALVRLCPAMHAPHNLHADLPVWSCHTWPDRHATQLDLPVVPCL